MKIKDYLKEKFRHKFFYTRSKAIKKHCYFLCDYRDNLLFCHDQNCPLYPYQTDTIGKSYNDRAKAIGKFCTEVCKYKPHGNSVLNCRHSICFLYPYRHVLPAAQLLKEVPNYKTFVKLIKRNQKYYR